MRVFHSMVFRLHELASHIFICANLQEDEEWVNGDNSFRFSPHNPFSKQYHVKHKSTPIPVPSLSARFNSPKNSQVSPSLNEDSRSPLLVARRSTNPFEDFASAEAEPETETHEHQPGNVRSNDSHQNKDAQEKGIFFLKKYIYILAYQPQRKAREHDIVTSMIRIDWFLCIEQIRKPRVALTKTRDPALKALSAVKKQFGMMRVRVSDRN